MKAILLAAVMMIEPAMAHDRWADGTEVPPWVKAACCGPRDVHHLKPSEVHITADGYLVDGIASPIPIAKAQPSMDGEFWIFYNPIGLPDPVIFCFFAPLNGV